MPRAWILISLLVPLGCSSPETPPPHDPSGAEPAGASPSEGARPGSGGAAPIAPLRGPTCLPVAQCASFAAPRCAVLRLDDHGTQLEPGPELQFVRAWPNTEGVGASVTTALDYFESQRSCRRRPLLETPGFSCELRDGTCEARPQ
ncbi:MAG: hypothetical protein KDK70_24505 [Myxococcales bacterium]|nr:hypothetical protein [Myxococcales bacterium]